jgi:hypothetical protein
MNQTNNTNKLINIVALVSYIAYVLVSCAYPERRPPLEIGDGGFLSKEPCGPPCFMGIIPGTTTEQETQKIISEFDGLEECSTWNAKSSGLQEGIRCAQTMAVLFDNAGVVSTVSFTPQQVITVEEAIYLYGMPDVVGMAPMISDYETPTVSVSLYFHDYYLRLSMPVQEGFRYEIEPGTVIRSIIYYEKEEYSRQLEFTQPWKGYGFY